MAKVGIIGTGKNGEAFAQRLLSEGHEVNLINRTRERAVGLTEDLLDAHPEWDGKIHVEDDYSDRFMDTDVAIVVAKGSYDIRSFRHCKDKANLRMKVLKNDGVILHNIAKNLTGYKGKVIVVSNPVDIVAREIMHTAKFDPKNVVSYGANLDTWRGKNITARKLGINLNPRTGHRDALNLSFVGDHGDGIFGLWSQATFKGTSLTEKLTIVQREEIDQYVKKRGTQIIINKGDTSIGTTEPLPELITWLTHYSELHSLPIGVYDKEHDIFYGLPALHTEEGIKTPTVGKMNADEKRGIEATVEKLSGTKALGELFFTSRPKTNILYIDSSSNGQRNYEEFQRQVKSDDNYTDSKDVSIYVAKSFNEANEQIASTVGGMDLIVGDIRNGNGQETVSYVDEKIGPHDPFTKVVLVSANGNAQELGDKVKDYTVVEQKNDKPLWQEIRKAI